MLDSNFIGRFDPSSKTFAEFPLPTLTPTARFIALDESGGSTVVWVSYTGSNKIARLQFR
jgi:streptogramin lyase